MTGQLTGRWIALVAMLIWGAAIPTQAAEGGAQLWRGGTIITMDGERPRTVEAVVVVGGRIEFAGKEGNARRRAGPDAIIHDLKGRTMLPGFVDAHSHFAVALQTAGWDDLRGGANPPRTIAELQQRIAARIAELRIPPGQWVILWQYDQESLAEKRHISRAEIDAIAPDHPVLVFHVSLHGIVANSAALAKAAITDDCAVPPGGIAPRDADGRLNGTLFEKAMDPVLAALPRPTPARLMGAIDAAQNLYLAEGYTHAQDGYTQPRELAFLTSDAVRGGLKLDLVLLAGGDDIAALAANPALQFGSYRGRVKVQGVKLILDGSPQARTAFFTRDYARGSPEGAHPWHGKPIISTDQFVDRARQANDRGWQLFIHANGDAAIDMAIAGLDNLGIKAADNRRPVIIHSQFQRPDQLSHYARIGVGPAYFSNHSWYWADVHRTNFPKQVVDFISPFRAAKAAGLIASNHSDYGVTPLDTRFQLWTSMARISPTGVVSGPDQRLSAYEALQALTTGPAWQVFEEDRKGRIKAGFLADFVILDRNPLTTPRDAIKGIKVLETIKEGATVWRRAGE